MDAPAVIGRVLEQRVLEQFLGEPGDEPRALILEGDAGIGKSMIWSLGVAQALDRNLTVASARGTQSETGLAFSGLTDLFDYVDSEVFEGLPAAKRIVLEVAMLRRAPSAEPIGQREVSAAALALLRSLTAAGPLVLAIDDLQWLDRPSAEALAFALRRLPDQPVRLLATRRTPGGVAPAEPDDRSGVLTGALPPATVNTVTLGPLDQRGIAALLADQLQLRLQPGALRGLIARTGGNPLWALELGRAIARADDHSQLPLPEGLLTLIGQRLAELDAGANEALLVVAALAYPTFELCTRALAGVVPDPATAIDAGVEAGVLTVAGTRLHLAHPLLGSVALERLPPGARADLHTRLAATTADPEQHARHLALARPGRKDPEVAEALEDGAAAALARGATSTAANLVELAVQFTPLDRDADLIRRTVQAADVHHALGNLELAYDHASHVYGKELTVEQRRQVLPLLLDTFFWHRGSVEAQKLIRATLDDPERDPYLRAIALASAAENGDGLGTPRSQLARQAEDILEQSEIDSDPYVAAYVLVILADIRLKSGNGFPEDYLRRAEMAQRQRPMVRFTQRATTIRAFFLKAVDDLDGARTALHSALAVARDEGEDGVVPLILGHLTLTECWAGRYEDAAIASEEGLRLAGPRNPVMLALYAASALLRVLTGDPEGARELLADQPDNRDEINPFMALPYDHVLGAAALLSNDDETAVELLSSAYTKARDLEIHEPGRRYRLESDLGQALINAGRLEEAADLAAELRELGTRQNRPTILGIGLRLDALVLSQRGDPDAAEPLASEAVTLHEQSPFPLERGLSLFALGRVQRRRKARAQARASIQAALDCFSELGATAYARFARLMLEQLGGSRGGGSALTDAERRIADLLATGMSNREIAAALYSSVRTVEGHLSSIYRKLGIHSRTELIRRHSRA